MLIHYKKPDNYLSNFIDHYWEKQMIDKSDIPYDIETIFPEDQAVLTFSLGNTYYRAVKDPINFSAIEGALFESLHTHPTYYKHQVGNHIFGVKFKFGGMSCFSNTSFKNFNNTNTPISTFLGEKSDNLLSTLAGCSLFEERIKEFEKFLKPYFLVEREKKWNRLIQFIDIIEHDKEISQALYKTITRYFIELTGITPKDYLQLRRINQSLAYFAQNKSSKNQELADLLGFYDTAHFNHTFKKFTGKTPQSFVTEIEKMEPNEFIEEFKQYISPEHLLYYSSKKHQ
jgi:AraC-like DNA-binding protein